VFLFVGLRFQSGMGNIIMPKLIKMVKGEIVRFSYNKGNYIHVKYYYQSREYIVKEMESNDDNRYLIGHEVSVMLDTTDPCEAYVVEFN
jgi:hypothetical protein